MLTRPRGYELQVGEGDELDLDAFERLVHEGRELLEGDGPATRRRSSREALELWRGAALADLRSEPFAEEAAPRLEEAGSPRSRTGSTPISRSAATTG